jgi:hypothetical protein
LQNYRPCTEATERANPRPSRTGLAPRPATSLCLPQPGTPRIAEPLTNATALIPQTPAISSIFSALSTPGGSIRSGRPGGLRTTASGEDHRGRFTFIGNLGNDFLVLTSRVRVIDPLASSIPRPIIASAIPVSAVPTIESRSKSMVAVRCTGTDRAPSPGMDDRPVIAAAGQTRPDRA